MLKAILAVVALATCGASTVGWAQDPYRSDGGYIDSFYREETKVSKHFLRFLWTGHFPPGSPTYAIFARCLRYDELDYFGTNKVIFKNITASGVDSLTEIKLPTLKGQVVDGYMDYLRSNQPVLANLAGETAVLIQAQVIVKGTVGPNNYFYCSMDVTEFE
jgi:hypothetical protein